VAKARKSAREGWAFIDARDATRHLKDAIYSMNARREHRAPARRQTMKRRHLIGAASAAAMLPRLAVSQSYPSRPIRYIVPVAAGGGNDMIARVVTERWGRQMNNATFVVENLGGGGGVVACTTTLRAPPDGYTLMQGYVATHGTTPATRKVSYDAVKDFTPIGMIGATPNVLAVNASMPVKTMKEFVDFVKKQPGKIT